jgi:hypothetical protein
MARRSVSDAVRAVKGSIASVGGVVRDVRDRLPSVKETRRRVETLRTLPSRSPVGLAVGSILAGLLVGFLVPLSDVERRVLRPIGKQMTKTAQLAALAAMERGEVTLTQRICDAIAGSSRAFADRT